MKIDEIRGKTDGELEFELKGLTKELFDLRFKTATENSANPSRIREARRSVARIHTILHERSNKIRGQEPR
ncbi:MAG: 50S ribosomal protein L29 [Planctomycetes bacterium]|nr:50S ribosomal protein L29 [Planctomycetota bacterium]